MSCAMCQYSRSFSELNVLGIGLTGRGIDFILATIASCSLWIRAESLRPPTLPMLSPFALVDRLPAIMIDKIFKAYDVRATYPSPLNEEMAWKVGHATAQ